MPFHPTGLPIFLSFKISKHEGHKGNEGELSDDYGSLLSIIKRDGQNEVAPLHHSTNL
jgi:hypothetical protein